MTRLFEGLCNHDPLSSNDAFLRITKLFIIIKAEYSLQVISRFLCGVDGLENVILFAFELKVL